MVDDSECKIEGVSYVANIEYSTKQDCQDKLQRKNALSMLVSQLPDNCSETEQQLVVRAKVVESKINGLQKSLLKECTYIRMRKRTYQAKSEREVIMKFLNNRQLFDLTLFSFRIYTPKHNQLHLCMSMRK